MGDNGTISVGDKVQSDISQANAWEGESRKGSADHNRNIAFMWEPPPPWMEFVEDAILETETFPGTPTINLGEKTAGHVKLLYKQYDEQKSNDSLRKCPILGLQINGLIDQKSLATPQRPQNSRANKILSYILSV